MIGRPSPVPEEAVNLLRQAGTTLAYIWGNTGWPTITAQMSIGATILVHLLANCDTQFDAVSFVGMTVWMPAPLVLVIAFAKVAKNSFGTRWGVYMAVRALCWSTSTFFPAVAVRVPLTAVVAVASFVDTLVEACR